MFALIEKAKGSPISRAVYERTSFVGLRARPGAWPCSRSRTTSAASPARGSTSAASLRRRDRVARRAARAGPAASATWSSAAGAPVVVQSMTNTDTADAAATARQVAELAEAGSEIVRITVNNRAAARAGRRDPRSACATSTGLWCRWSGDFHYNGHTLLREFPDCADALDKYRINPGNVGRGARHDANFATMVAGRRRPRQARCGSASTPARSTRSSLDRLMDENAPPRRAAGRRRGVAARRWSQSALTSAEAAEELGLPGDRIVLSCKASRLQDMVAVYRDLARRCAYPLHLGLTEAGMGSKGIVSTTAALGILLQEGIGDTIRASLTPEPGRRPDARGARLPRAAAEPRPALLPPRGHGLPRLRAHHQHGLPGAGPADRAPPRRAHGRLARERPAVAGLTVAVMGCIVNGPGESRAADIGISLPGTGEQPRAPVYVDGEKVAHAGGPDAGRRLHRDGRGVRRGPLPAGRRR